MKVKQNLYTQISITIHTSRIDDGVYYGVSWGPGVTQSTVTWTPVHATLTAERIQGELSAEGGPELPIVRYAAPSEWPDDIFDLVTGDVLKIGRMG